MMVGCPKLMRGGTAAGYAKAVGASFDLPALEVDGDLALAQSGWRQQLADHLYGEIPPPPDETRFARHPIAAEGAERIEISLRQDGRQFGVDAALWLPQDARGPVPIICGLDFVGPAGVMSTDGFPLDPDAKVVARRDLGAGDGRLSSLLRGTSMHRWPIHLIHQAGFGLLLSCYGSWTPDDPKAWAHHGVHPLMKPKQSGAISLWAWALQRLVDVAQDMPEVDAGRIALAGHSRLGKAALWAAAQDSRIAAVFANNSGCGGAAPVRHFVGETLERMARVFPHWTRPDVETAPDRQPIDQHHLLACIAPRGVYLGNAEDDIWADPVGSYHALMAASACWPDIADWPEIPSLWVSGESIYNGGLGYHLRPGAHEILPYDWHHFLKFLSGLDDFRP